ncbi:MAG: hypothetical protein PHU11_07030 [Dysgonamonadaceae bacterium]|nr:hypothetical protein [Dysgonamonadaceae bacterium]
MTAVAVNYRNMLAVELPLWLDIGNVFVVKPTLRSNNDNVLSA